MPHCQVIGCNEETKMQISTRGNNGWANYWICPNCMAELKDETQFIGPSVQRVRFNEKMAAYNSLPFWKRIRAKKPKEV